MILYFTTSLIALAGLAAMIVFIAKSMASCPDSSRRARAAGVTIATGYIAIGAGVVFMVGTLPLISDDSGVPVFAMGLAHLILGLGFTQAMRTLHAVVEPKPVPPERLTTPSPVEPVLA
jgi:hypothetical protein